MSITRPVKPLPLDQSWQRTKSFPFYYWPIGIQDSGFSWLAGTNQTKHTEKRKKNKKCFLTCLWLVNLDTHNQTNQINLTGRSHACHTRQNYQTPVTVIYYTNLSLCFCVFLIDFVRFLCSFVRLFVFTRLNMKLCKIEEKKTSSVLLLFTWKTSNPDNF